jgi:hypothetical protein
MRWGTKAIGAALVALAFAALWLPAVAAAAPTLSDGFAGRSTESGLPVVASGSNVGAGREMGEPVLKPLAPAGHSVWLEWEATDTGFVTISTCGSGIPTVLGIYEGADFEHFAEVRSVANFAGPECTPMEDGVTFKAQEGVKYEVVVDGNAFFVPPAAPSTGEGPISLRIEATPPPPNDDFANGTVLTGRITEEPGGARFYFVNELGYNWGATREPGEPVHAGGLGGASVWYRWTAPETGTALISANSIGPWVRFAVYTGSGFGSLEQLFGGVYSVQMPVVAGTTYWIVVDGEPEGGTGEMGTFLVGASMRLAPNPGVPSSASATSARPDTVAPRTSIGKRKVRSKAGSASFSFGADETGSTFRCKLDARKAARCTSPKGYAGLAPGPHTFKVYAVDAAGNADPTPATVRFSIARPRRGQK